MHVDELRAGSLRKVFEAAVRIRFEGCVHRKLKHGRRSDEVARELITPVR